MTEKWCDWHCICTEDVGKDTFSCLAHLDSSRVFECPYKSPENRNLSSYQCVEYIPIKTKIIIKEMGKK